jgi:hypothetical protein
MYLKPPLTGHIVSGVRMNQDDMIENIFQHAADKEALVANLRDELIRETRKENPKRITELSHELTRQIAKRNLRLGEAKQVSRAGVVVSVYDLSGTLVAQGLLRSVSPKARTVSISMAGSDGPDKTLTYAELVPVPPELTEEGQTYYGVRLILKFKVVSIPDGNRRMLR